MFRPSIAKFCLRTLLHLAGYFLKCKIVEEQFTGLSNKGSSVIIGESRQVVEHYQEGEGADALKNEVQKHEGMWEQKSG